MATLVLAFLAGCVDSSTPPKPDIATERRPVVSAVSYPLAFFAEFVGGEAIEVHYPIPPGQDPSTWMPDTESILKFQQSDRILLNGGSLVPWVEQVSLPESKLIRTTDEIESSLIPIATAVTHRHGPEGDDVEPEMASTTWLDLSMAGQQAARVRDSLIELLPEHEQAFERRFLDLKAALDGLDRRLMEVSDPESDRPFFVAEPVYQYLARRYAMNVVTLDWDAASVPDESAWARLAEVRKSHPADVMLWPSEPDPEVSRRLRELGISVVVFDPVAAEPVSGQFLSIMERNVDRLIDALDSD
ncbi:MAG: metal ABC transporter substrate-binding protein [Planctomycetota bacterium]